MIQVMGKTGSCPHSTIEQLAATFFITLTESNFKQRWKSNRNIQVIWTSSSPESTAQLWSATRMETWWFQCMTRWTFWSPILKKSRASSPIITLISVSTTLEWLLCGSLATVHQQQSRFCQRYHVLWAVLHHWCQMENLPVQRNSWLLYWCVIMQLSGRRIEPRLWNVIMCFCLSCVKLHKHSSTIVATRVMTIWRQ